MRTIVALTVAIAAHAGAADLAPDAKQQAMKLLVVRCDKASYVVARLYHYGDRRDFLPYVPALVSEHRRLEAKAGKRADGFGAAYWFSLVYGAANFGLRCYARAPGGCVGPLDCKRVPGAIDPRVSIRHHVAEMLEGYLRGYRDRGLCEYVFYPAAPRDWGGGRFQRTDARMRGCLDLGYKLGKVGPTPRQRNAVEIVALEPTPRKRKHRAGRIAPATDAAEPQGGVK